MRHLILIILLSQHVFSLQAQFYKTTWGVRLDDDQFGFNLTQKVAKEFTIELFSDFDKKELRYGGHIRHHSKIAGSKLNWCQGVGAHGGLLKPRNSFWGINPVVGAEYKFMLFPLLVSFDINPFIYISGSHPEFWSLQTIFSIKYVLVKEEKRKKWRERMESRGD